MYFLIVFTLITSLSSCDSNIEADNSSTYNRQSLLSEERTLDQNSQEHTTNMLENIDTEYTQIYNYNESNKILISDNVVLPSDNYVTTEPKPFSVIFRIDYTALQSQAGPSSAPTYNRNIVVRSTCDPNNVYPVYNRNINLAIGSPAYTEQGIILTLNFDRCGTYDIEFKSKIIYREGFNVIFPTIYRRFSESRILRY